MAFEDSSQRARRPPGPTARASGVQRRVLAAAPRDRHVFRGRLGQSAVPRSRLAQSTATRRWPCADRVPPPNLDYVFDDPADGEPGRDRMLVHGLWELVLALALAGVGYLLYRARASAPSAASDCVNCCSARPCSGLVAAGQRGVAAGRRAEPRGRRRSRSPPPLYFGQHGSAAGSQPAAGRHRHLRRDRAGAGPGRGRSAGAGLGGEPRRSRSDCSPGRSGGPQVRSALATTRAARLLLVRRVLRAEPGRERGRPGADAPPRHSAGSVRWPTRPAAGAQSPR